MITLTTAQRGDGWHWITVDGDLHQDSAAQLQRRLDELVGHGHNRVVLDLKPTAKLDFDALVALVLARGRLKNDGGELLLRCPSTDVSRLLELTGLTDLLDVLDDCAAS
ncbi:MAG: STAS domain-containing protein [Acidimicrobiia bacterium]|jgi:anti-anti-sigma factor|nr:STAS domain-containing protein [Acidimicrobiia bacterium]MBV8986373.1 STAS domain-containing protein [Acidimicrobiia bacterium]MBV9040501.1 STAS domain-containing protein [Acidimicrobiia bacterium]